MGPDIENVAKHNNKTVEEVIKIHTSEEYLIYMLGFIAGFPYLGGMSKEIATPRLTSPRVKIEADLWELAGEQTRHLPGGFPGRLAVNRPHAVKALRRRTGGADSPLSRTVYQIPLRHREGVQRNRKAGCRQYI